MGHPAFARQHGLARVATNPCSRYVKRRGSLAIHMQSVNACHLCFTSWLSDCRGGEMARYLPNCRGWCCVLDGER